MSHGESGLLCVHSEGAPVKWRAKDSAQLKLDVVVDPRMPARAATYRDRENHINGSRAAQTAQRIVSRLCLA